MSNGDRLGLSILAGGAACMAALLLLVIVSVIVTGSPPHPRWSIMLPFIWVAVAVAGWRNAEHIDRWMSAGK